jgi:hypothetical protein
MWDHRDPATAQIIEARTLDGAADYVKIFKEVPSGIFPPGAELPPGIRNTFPDEFLDKEWGRRLRFLNRENADMNIERANLQRQLVAAERALFAAKGALAVAAAAEHAARVQLLWHTFFFYQGFDFVFRVIWSAARDLEDDKIASAEGVSAMSASEEKGRVALLALGFLPGFSSARFPESGLIVNGSLGMDALSNALTTSNPALTELVDLMSPASGVSTTGEVAEGTPHGPSLQESSSANFAILFGTNWEDAPSKDSLFQFSQRPDDFRLPSSVVSTVRISTSTKIGAAGQLNFNSATQAAGGLKHLIFDSKCNFTGRHGLRALNVGGGVALEEFVCGSQNSAWGKPAASRLNLGHLLALTAARRAMSMQASLAIPKLLKDLRVKDDKTAKRVLSAVQVAFGQATTEVPLKITEVWQGVAATAVQERDL